MCGGVASRLEDENFWNGITRLASEFGIKSKDLVSFMCNSVASRLNNSKFWDELEKIRSDINIKTLRKFKRNIVALTR